VSREPQPSRAAFVIGVTLILASFIVYPAYPLIALLPVPVDLRVTVAVAASFLSWTIFFIGTALAGKRGIEYAKRLVMRRKVPPLPPR